MQRNCTICGKSIVISDKRAWNKKYCSKECAYSYTKSEYSKRGVSTMSVGTIAELLVCSDLLKKGFSVFRSVSPNSNFDIVAFRNNKILSFEVRTGRIKRNGKVEFLKKENDKAKYYAVVIHKDDKIIYFPELK